MKVVIDRFEGAFAVVETEDGSFVDMPAVLAAGAKEGDVLDIRIDQAETQERKKRIQSLMDQLFQ